MMSIYESVDLYPLIDLLVSSRCPDTKCNIWRRWWK